MKELLVYLSGKIKRKLSQRFIGFLKKMIDFKVGGLDIDFFKEKLYAKKTLRHLTQDIYIY